jgi:hypothetical protein
MGLMVIGYWLMVNGYWLMVNGYWLMASNYLEKQGYLRRRPVIGLRSFYFLTKKL